MNSTSHHENGRKSKESLPESTRIYHGVNVIINAILQILNHTNRIQICVDQSRPALMIDIAELKDAFIAAKRHGVKLRCITEITKNNLSYCKQMLTMVDELRHLDGIKGNLYLNELGCFSSATINENGLPSSKGLYSNIKESVEHQQCLFDTLWTVCMPAQDRIEQLDEGVEREFLQVITYHEKVLQVLTKMVKSMENETLILVSNDMTMIGLNRLGIIDHIIKASTRKMTAIKIICPFSEKNMKLLKRIKEIAPSIEILIKNSSLFSMFIIDKQRILGMEVRQLDTDDFLETIDFGLYSNRKLAVNSFGSIFDIVWRERMLNEQLKNRDKVQRDFINIAAHELRTPIQPIIGLSEVLRYKKAEGQLHQDKILDVIIRNAKRLQNLSEDLLDVTRIESHSMVLKKEKFNLNQLILNVITDSRNYFASENIDNNKKNSIETINIEPIFKGKEDVYLEADKNRINQVILNLLVNAIRFTKKGTITIKTDIQQSRYDENTASKVVLINIKDTGSGINSKIFPRLFTKFTLGSPGGTGLGLFISKNIIEAHGGKMWAENNQNERGATFSFTLPALAHTINDVKS